LLFASAIALEKSGIIKPHTPVVIGEVVAETQKVFLDVSKKKQAEILFADEDDEVISVNKLDNGLLIYNTKSWGEFEAALSGECQIKNTKTLLCAMKQLIQILPSDKQNLLTKVVPQAFKSVTKLTGLRGRWEQIYSRPTIICDTGHNIGGWEYLSKQIADQNYAHTHIIFGMAGDKDVDKVLRLMPQEATYYFTRASVKRSLGERELQKKAEPFHLQGEAYPNVAEAFASARERASQHDLIFVGGSNFVVADFLEAIAQ
jgi:dihydrofolate synthase/folylpolyglutamate synthase